MVKVREFKFRAWSHGVKADSVSSRRQFGEWVFPPQMMHEEKLGDCLVWKSQGQNIEVMQYTGLKDRNGKEIFEGDVVHLSSDDGIDYHAQIIFKDGGFCAIDGTEDSYSVRRYGLMRFELSVEVVGNIYENPELIQK